MGSEHSILHILTPFDQSSVEVEWINYPQLPVLEKESTCTSTASPTSYCDLCFTYTVVLQLVYLSSTAKPTALVLVKER
jgi:hypothetical protein